MKVTFDLFEMTLNIANYKLSVPEFCLYDFKPIRNPKHDQVDLKYHWKSLKHQQLWGISYPPIRKLKGTFCFIGNAINVL